MSRLEASKRAEILAAVDAGESIADVSERLHVARSTAYKVVHQRRAAKASASAAPQDRDARELRDRLLRAAHRALDHVEAQLEDGSVQSQPFVAVGIATQRFLEAEKKLAATDGLPEALPEDDDEARRVVLQGWWQAARQGDANAMRHLAEAYGLKHANQQPVVVTFDDGDTAGGPAT